LAGFTRRTSPLPLLTQRPQRLQPVTPIHVPARNVRLPPVTMTEGPEHIRNAPIAETPRSRRVAFALHQEPIMKRSHWITGLTLIAAIAIAGCRGEQVATQTN